MCVRVCGFDFLFLCLFCTARIFVPFAEILPYCSRHTIHEGRSISLGSNAALPLRHGATPTPGLRYKNLGKSGLRVSNVGLGTWPVFSPGVSEEQAEAILKLAVESGINMFDISEAHSGNLTYNVRLLKHEFEY